ncbi:MAG: hypothetical protein GY804_01045 [Alphaproteobacteria bacterium]|nr:hypothetical protein [Alphaproteobacteria bacterium]
MTDSSVKRLGLILAVKAELEGMKIENTRCKLNDLPPAYDVNCFFQLAEELRRLVNMHDQQL